MKFTTLINMAGINDAGFADKTDFSDWVILEYIQAWQINSKALIIDSHIWIDYKHLMVEIPMLGINSKAPISRRLNKLVALGLITVLHDDNSRVYVKLTDLYCDVVNFRGVIEKERGVIEKERGVIEKERGVIEKERGVIEKERGVIEKERGVIEKEHILNNQLLNNQDSQQQSENEFEENENEQVEEFEIDLSWKPTEEDLKFTLFRAGGFDIKNLNPDWLIEFVLHWSSEKRQHNQAKWTAKFAMKCIGYFRNPSLFDRQQAIRASPKANKAVNGCFPPKDDSELVSWMQNNGFGDGPIGYDYYKLRGWLRREIEKRLSCSVAK